MISLLGSTWQEFLRCWKQLFVTGLAYRLVSFVLLAPLVSLLFQLFLSFSSETLLADQDIAMFFASPIGILCLVLVGGLSIALFTLEMTALMTIVASPKEQEMNAIKAIGFTLKKTYRTFMVTARAIVIAACWIVPFLVALGIVYISLLGKFDINYYLNEKPPEFLVALSIGAVLGLALVVILVWKIISWIFAVPILTFESTATSDVLQVSNERTRGKRKTLLSSLLIWFLVSSFVAILLTSLTVGCARLLLPNDVTSLQRLAFSIGGVVVVSTLLNIVASLFGASLLATLVFTLYQKYGHGPETDPAHSLEDQMDDQSGWLRLDGLTLAIGVTIGVVAAVVIGNLIISGFRTEDHVDVIAHRGASVKAPENTMAAVRQAIDDKADWVEIDVQEIADGTVVVFHDSDFMKSAKRQLKIWEATPEDLKTIDIGSWFDPKFKDERVPTLEQVLRECKGKAGLYIELKYYGHDTDLERKVVDLVEAQDMADEVTIISLKAKGLAKIKSLRPDWKTGQLLSVYAGNLAKMESDMVAANSSFANWSFVQSAKKADKQVAVWTVNDAIQMSVMIGRGVNGLITDRPDVARKVLDQRSKMTGLQRLMLELAFAFGLQEDLPEIDPDP